MFALCRANNIVHAEGVECEFPPVCGIAIDDRLSDFFAAARCRTGPAVIVGALPFDVRAPVSLFQPSSFSRSCDALPFEIPARQTPPANGLRRVLPEPSAEGYAAMVRRALERIGSGQVDKIVLARSLKVEGQSDIDVRTIARHLAADSGVTTFLATLPDPRGGSPTTLVGATPELLVSRSGSHVLSHPLAGSAARREDESSDAEAARALLASDKDQREHAMVVEEILDILAPHCVSLSRPKRPGLFSTATMWHLGTRIEGILKAGAPSAAGLAALLHPTPAVGGFPRQAALDGIRALEDHDRGYYAGAIGWTDEQGDGEWFVTLRCAQIRGSEMALHAGAGIVAGSDPDAEVLETAAKFRTMLRALRLEDAVISEIMS